MADCRRWALRGLILAVVLRSVGLTQPAAATIRSFLAHSTEMSELKRL